MSGGVSACCVVEVTSPSEDVFEQLLEGPGAMVRRFLPLRSYRDLGPAVYLDAARFAGDASV